MSPKPAASAAEGMVQRSRSPGKGGNSAVFYGLGGLGLTTVTQAVGGYLLFYYVDVLGLSVALAATINVVYAIWDALNDPLVGYLSDNTRTRWGRRRPWLLAGLPFFLIFFVLLFSVPAFFRQGNRLFWYALVVIFLFEGASTVMLTNYESLFPELFRGLKSRARASAYSQGLGMAGELVGFALTPIMYKAWGFAQMALIIAAASGIILGPAILGTREDPAAQKHPPLDWRSAFGDIVRDGPFWHFTAVITLLWFTTGLFTIGTAFWTKYTLGAEEAAPSLIFAAVFITAIASVSLWSRSVRLWGIKRIWLVAIAIMALSTGIIGVANTLAVGIAGAVVAGAGLGGNKVCRELLMARLVDRSYQRSGHHREGVYYSLSRFIGRLSKILEALALLLLGLLFGYVSGDEPGPHPENAFRFLMSVLPLICIIIAWVLAWRLRLDPEPIPSVD